MSAPVELKIETNAVQARHVLDAITTQQLPFALSRSVNVLAYDLREAEQKKLGDYFDIRTNWLLKKGAMPVVPSRKTMKPEIYSILGVKDEVAAMSITGGTRKAKSGNMAVPLSNTGGTQTAREVLNPGTETLGPSRWPGRIVKARRKRGRNGAARKAKPFLLKSKKTGRSFVALRTSASRDSLMFLYAFEQSVEIKAAWPLKENATSYIAKHYDVVLARELEKAVRSSYR